MTTLPFLLLLEGGRGGDICLLFFFSKKPFLVFLRKIRKKNIHLLSAELAQRMVKVNTDYPKLQTAHKKKMVQRKNVLK